MPLGLSTQGGLLLSTVAEPDQKAATATGARAVFYQTVPNQQMLKHIQVLVDHGEITPLSPITARLEQAADIHRKLEMRELAGKIVFDLTTEA
ncbi:zinc-binding dehydrogenase [Dyadobacter sp. 676]|uniref:Zinc-binding dehydrogenase n=1 Tax=Dyadobacter sp. 676 TaxID=3088362 RepID=A0AAU8FTU6_9BACT